MVWTNPKTGDGPLSLCSSVRQRSVQFLVCSDGTLARHTARMVHLSHLISVSNSYTLLASTNYAPEPKVLFRIRNVHASDGASESRRSVFFFHGLVMHEWPRLKHLEVVDTAMKSVSCNRLLASDVCRGTRLAW